MGVSSRLSGAWHSSFLDCRGLALPNKNQGNKSLLLQRLPPAFGQCSTLRSSCNICWHKHANTELNMGKRLFLPCWYLNLFYFLLNIQGEGRGGSGASCPLPFCRRSPSPACSVVPGGGSEGKPGCPVCPHNCTDIQ